MTVSVAARVALAVAACASIIVLDAMWDDVFFADYPSSKIVEFKSPSGDVEGIGIEPSSRIPSTLEVTLRIAAPFLALASVAGYVASLVTRRKVCAGGLASACGALISISVVQYFIGYRLNLGYGRYVANMVIWGCISFGIGAAASWVASVWWPNTSLERTREE